MDLEKIRSLSDEELRKYITNLSKRNVACCSVCNKVAHFVVKITNNETSSTKQLCGLCTDCYKKTLDFLQTTDFNWD